MRKIKILLLSLLLAFCMAGCSEGSSVAISGSGDETAGKISQNGSGMEVHFIDVGQGDSTLIKVGGHAMLIDAGDNSEGTAVQSYLDSQNVEIISAGLMLLFISLIVKRSLCRMSPRIRRHMMMLCRH